MPKEIEPPSTMPEGLHFDPTGLVYGCRKSHEGLFELKFHNPKKKNAIRMNTMKRFGALINEAGSNPNVKCILIYGSKDFFSSGNDISVFLEFDDEEDQRRKAEEGVMVGVRDFISSIMDSPKPTVFFNRGKVLGMCWTVQGGADFVYCTPETTF